MLTKNTLKMYKFYHNKFLESGQDVQSYLKTLRVSTSSFNVIKGALEYYDGKINIDRSDCKIYQSSASHDILFKSTIEEIINKTQNDKHRLMLMMIYHTGMRPSEVINIKCCDIDLNKRIIIINESKNHNDKRYIEIDDMLYNELKSFQRMLASFYLNRYLFEVNSRPLSVVGIQHAIQLAGKRLKIDHFNARLLRHAYTTHFLTGNIKDIKQQLGHQSLSSTEIYID